MFQRRPSTPATARPQARRSRSLRSGLVAVSMEPKKLKLAPPVRKEHLASNEEAAETVTTE